MSFTEIGFFAEELLKNATLKLAHLKIDHFLIMPNHVHFIATIFKVDNDFKTPKNGLAPLVPCSTSSFVNRFKGRLKKWCNENNYESFEWQARFHDRIIRNDREYDLIVAYTLNNIKNWRSDSEKS